MTNNKSMKRNDSKNNKIKQYTKKGLDILGAEKILNHIVNGVTGLTSTYLKSSLKNKGMYNIYSIEGVSLPVVTVSIREFIYLLAPEKYDQFSFEPVLDESMYTKVKPLDTCTFVINRPRCTIIVHGRYIDNVFDASFKSFRTDVFIIGGNRKKYLNLYNKICRRVEQRLSTGDNIKVVEYSEEKGHTMNMQNKKLISSMVLPNSNRTAIEEKIQKFIDNKQVYLDHEIPYKLGILLYGKPGTGKTSLAKAIACKYGCPLAVINVNDILSFDDYNFDAARYNDTTVIALLEDIDCILNDNDDRKQGTGTSKLHKLLQILDGINSSDNVIYIATTNYIDRLDSALIRDGRFDLKIEMVDLNKDEAYEFGTKFNFTTTEMNEIFERNNITFPVNPAQLQNNLMADFLKKIK